MTFARPLVLLALVVPLVAAVWEWRRAGLRVPLPFDLLDAPPRLRLLPLLVRLAQLLPSAVAACAIVILAEPRTPGEARQVREVTNIELCLDVSGSMELPFGRGRRYDAAMQAINRFTERREGDAFGLTIFGNETLRWVPLTTDLSALALATPFVDPETLPQHFWGTEIGKGLEFCAATLRAVPEGDRLVIVLSDGRSADMQGDEARELGERLAADGIVLYSIFIGQGTATQQLYDVTAPTGGEVFAVDDPSALNAVFDHIDAMQPARTKPNRREPVEDFGTPALAGLVLLAAYAATLFGLRWSPW